MTDTNQPTESNQVEFHERVEPPVGRTRAARAGIVAGAAFLFVVGAVAAMGASPAPPTGADPAAPPAADPNGAAGTNGHGDRPGFGGFRGPRGMGLGEFGPFGFRDITISAINGSDVSLTTDDGWTRTIAVTTTTKITKGGTAISIGDLAVGDQIVFGQDRATDGTYTVTAIKVVLPTTGGEVSAINGDIITVTQPGGTTATIHVNSNTKYRVNGATGTLSDIKVGSFIVAEGAQRTDGSLDAAAIGAGDRGAKGPGFPGAPHLPDDDQDPNASPTPSSTTS